MKDRLLLYDEKKKILLTENHYSPTEIYKINGTNFLFVTRVGNSASGIINLGVYNTENFSMVGELLNDYREIKILADNNKAWLYNIKSNTIHCYELAHQTKKYLTELKSFENFNDYFLDDANLNIYINHNEVLKVSSLNNLHKYFEIPKKENNAIDKLGNVFTLENRTLKCTSLHTNYSETFNLDFEVNLQSDNYIHIGKHLRSEIELTDLNRKAEEIKEEVISSLPDSKTYHYHALPESQRISEIFTTHKVYPTKNGVFIIQKRIKRDFNGVTLRKYQTTWTATPYKIENTEITLLLFNSEKADILIDKTPNLTVYEYLKDMLVVSHQSSKILFSGKNKVTISNEDSIELFTINEIGYFLIKTKERYSLFRSTNPNYAILEQIEILNPDHFKKHQIIWYRGKEKNISNTKYLNAFDLKNCTRILIDEQKVQHPLFKDALDFKFFEKYAFSSNQIVFNPETLEIKDAFIGNIESHSKQLNKIVSHRTNKIYLSKFNHQIEKYELSEIAIDDNKYRESYLSPNGQFLVLQDESNKYSFYDIEKGETINFISGNFLAFRNDGSLIVEQDGSRAVKIIDPKTFQDITPPTYHHYRFMSPDGKLYAQVSSKVRYFHKLNGKELKVEEVSKFRQDLDEPSIFLEEKEKEQAKIRVDKNRQLIFNSYKEQFQSLGLEDYTKINSHYVVKIEKYTEFGITGTSIVKEIVLPEDTQFYNYASFSYDNKYLGLVYRLGTGGGIHFIKINFDEKKSSLEILDTYLSRYPRYASWVCGFSKTGYFATYDSTPDTYILFVDDGLFNSKTTEVELRQNIYNSKTNIYHTYKKWNEIKGKNFLCFSPTGNFLALSEQGYEPLTLGGYGHQESNVVHIAKTGNGQIIDSFTGHGDKIKDNKTKKVTFVAFSEDESRIMTLSSDGVVIIRDINISDNEQDDKMPAANKRLAAMAGDVVN
jgi:WD40 repeat protein